MQIPTSKSKLLLRELFDELIEIPSGLRKAKIDALDLPEQFSIRLQAMVAFNELVEHAPELRDEKMSELDLPEKVCTRLRVMLVADSKIPALQSTAAESLIRHHDGDDLAQSLVGTSIGAFRLLALIGQGGSSVVFRAERKIGNGSQMVALKLLRTGLYSEDAQRRFRREQAILAQLTHPNIARLIEGGVSSAGIPYIAMELVDGLPITRAADERGLSIEQRLAWFSKLCRTIDVAHMMLIVHRDIKPSNLLVTNNGELKVLDFGIAKLADAHAHVTRTQSIALTPEYAAPEQFGSAPLTTAVDVYSLGVVLGELLTGKRLNSRARASSAVDVSNNISILPKGLPGRLALSRRLRGDLDAILACALADEPALRYHSAGAFADDIERYLAEKPVRAHPPSRWYRTRKFVSRHYASVAMTAAFALAIIAALAVALWQAGVAQEQARTAHDQAQRAEAARDLLVSVFNAASADLPKQKRPSVQDIVEHATSHLMAQNTLPDALRADLLVTLAKVSISVGSYDRALALLDQAAPMIKHLYRSQATIWWEATVLRASVLWHKSLRTESIALLEPLQDQLLARHDRIGIDGLLTLSLALLHDGQIDQGLTLAHQAVAIARDEAAPMPDVALSAMINEASLLLDAQHFRQAFQRADAALGFWRQQGEPPSQSIIELYENIAVGAEASGDIARAESAYKQAIALDNQFFDKPNPSIAWDVGLYATFLIAQGRFEEAEPYARQGLQMRRAVFGDEDPHTLSAIAGMGKLYLGRHELAAAVEWNTQGVNICRTHAVNDVICPRLLALRGRAYGQDGRFEEADRDLYEALSLQRSLSGEATPAYAYILDNLLVVQIHQHDYQAAVATADNILKLRQTVEGGMIQADLLTRFHRAQALFGLARNNEAMAELQEIEPRYSTVFPKGDLRFDMLALKARALAHDRRFHEARSAAQSALALENKWSKPGSRILNELKRLANIDAPSDVNLIN